MKETHSADRIQDELREEMVEGIRLLENARSHNHDISSCKLGSFDFNIKSVKTNYEAYNLMYKSVKQQNDCMKSIAKRSKQ